MNAEDIKNLLALRPMSQNTNEDRLNLGFGWFTYSIIRNLQPDKVLVVGSGYGFIPAVAAMACVDNDKGMVDFVDADFDNQKDGFGKAWGGAGIWHTQGLSIFDNLPIIKKHLQLHIMDDKTFIGAISEDEQYGYIYIDADHSYDGAKQTFDLCWPKLSKGGILVMHDVLVEEKYEGWPEFGVARFWKELNKGVTVNVWPGLGILSK